jgi:dTDP-4-amino-4,6-dideoxygalactose transaminase
MSAVPQAGAEIQISGDINNLKVNENYLDDQTLRTPKEYMFARSDFSVEKAKLEEVLDTGVLFRYHEPNAEDIPVAKLEQAFCDKFGFKYALGVNSASSGLLLSLLASGVQPGDSVLMPAFTFVAVPSSITLAGAKPVLVEINQDYAMDPDHLEE